VPHSDSVVGPDVPRGQPQKRSSPTTVYDADEVAVVSEANRHRQDQRMSSASKRMRSANVEVN